MDNNKKLPVLCIVGPTASGKSDFGVAVARAVGGEIISADAMQVYRRMDIGTAKLRHEEMQGVPHHLLDVVDPDEDFSVASWTELADKVIVDICGRGRLPLVVGGTGLYIRSIVDNLNFSESSKSEEVRAKWSQYAGTHGNDALHRILQEQDPEAARRLHPNDVRRVIRALEVLETTGEPISAAYQWDRRDGRYKTVQFGLAMDREALYDRVERRIDKMLDEGLATEVAELLHYGYHRDLISMQAIGYKEIAAYLNGMATLDEAIVMLKRNTRRFVKRQLSWFHRDERITWLSVDPVQGISEEQYEKVCKTGARLKAGIPRL